MRRLFTKQQLLTVPNLLSVVRLLLIPLMVYLYCEKQAYTAVVWVLLISGLTDVVDGFIARRFHAVSDLGKLLDPIADKLTQGAILICLAMRYRRMPLLIIVFAVKEVLMSVLGLWVLKRTDTVNSSKWYGKATTVILYAVAAVLVLFPTIPLAWADGLIGLCVAAVTVSFVLYARFYISLLYPQAD